MEGGTAHVFIWEFEVARGAEDAFLTHYAPGGSWSALFSRADGYLGSELLRDEARPERFVTLDRWTSRGAFETFRRQYSAEYDALDRTCTTLTACEIMLGEFTALPMLRTR